MEFQSSDGDTILNACAILGGCRVPDYEFEEIITSPIRVYTGLSC